MLQYRSTEVSLADHSRKRRVGIQVAVSAGLIVAFGAAVNAVDDAKEHSAVLGITIATILIIVLVIATSLSSRTGVFPAILAVVLVIGAFLTSMSAFEMTPLRESIGMIREGDPPETLARNSLLLRLWICWCPTLLVAVMALAVSRRREVWLGLCVAVISGAASALLWGANYSACRPVWFRILKWPKFLSTGLLFLVAGTLTFVLAKAIGGARDRHARRGKIDIAQNDPFN